MSKARNLLLAKYLRGIARYTLLVIFSLVFIISLLSGSGDYGGGLMGILKNSMNSVPWLILLSILFIAWKWELIGGILITTIGTIAIYYFNLREAEYLKFTFFMGLIIIIFGSFLIISWYIRRNASKLS
jgi:hypothetical protein